jgi:D-alanyl-D-alanine-carboxypeptidase/D-alanyl-D-alanine-endopeptidase
VQALVQPLLEKKQSVGVVVGVIKAGRAQVFGFGREATGVDKMPDGKTIFEIGSVTKVFTSLALAEMAQESLVRIDDPVQRYLPKEVNVATRAGRELTLEDLATHTSGLPRIPLKMVLLGVKSNDPYATYSEKDLYDFLKIWKPTQDIGSKWAYSNLGAGLLGQVLSRRAGVNYGQLIANRITEPLGMNDTRVTLNGEQERRLAKPYEMGGTPASRWTFDALAGCGALHSTADDFLVFLAAELGLKETRLRAAMEATQKPRRETGIAGMRMGLAWIREEASQGRRRARPHLAQRRHGRIQQLRRLHQGEQDCRGHLEQHRTYRRVVRCRRHGRGWRAEAPERKGESAEVTRPGPDRFAFGGP